MLMIGRPWCVPDARALPDDVPRNATAARATSARKGKTLNVVKRADIHTSPQPWAIDTVIGTKPMEKVSIPHLRYRAQGLEP